MTASMKKLMAGSGYTYLVSQVATNDTLSNKHGDGLDGYYTAKGERPGRWVGSGLDGLGEGFDSAQPVTAAQIKALFGEGRHPDADALQDAEIKAKIGAGATEKQAAAAGVRATRIGTPYRVKSGEDNAFVTAIKQAYRDYARGVRTGAHTATDEATEGAVTDALLADAEPDQAGTDERSLDGDGGRMPAISPEVRAELRTQVGRETFAAQYGREPFDDRELSGHIARETRAPKQTVAGYDVTFSPVKSVSILWALGTGEAGARRVRDAVELAVDTGVAQALAYLEENGLYTRRGKAGVRKVQAGGLVAAAFTHRDSRAGDPDLHVHVPIANKVQDPADGSWLAIDGTVLYPVQSVLAKIFDTTVEQVLHEQLGLTFATREGTGLNGKEPVREVVGVPAQMIEMFSKRRRRIGPALGELSAAFHAEHGRAPTPTEAIALAQQATLDTREGKHEPRSQAEQDQAWHAETEQFLAATGDDQIGPSGIDAPGPVAGFMAQFNTPGGHTVQQLSGQDLADIPAKAIAAAASRRAVFTPTQVARQIARLLPANLASGTRSREAINQLLQAALDSAQVVRLDPESAVVDPVELRHTRGVEAGRSQFAQPLARQYTTRATLAAEQVILDAATAPADRFVVPTETVQIELLEAVANGKPLDPSQELMVTQMATSGKPLQAAEAPAGAGKTTAMRSLARAWRSAGGTVVGLTPTAVAAIGLGQEIGGDSDVLAKLAWHARGGPGTVPDWMERIGPDTLVIGDEIGMASTADFAAAVQYVTSRGGSMRVIGDYRQLASPGAGGVLRDIVHVAGAITLTELHRFKTAGEAATTLALATGKVDEALGFLLDNGRVHIAPATAGADTLYDKAAALGDGISGVIDGSTLMVAHTNADVEALNARARADRISAGHVDPGAHVTLAGGSAASAGDRVVTRSVDRRLRVLGGKDHVKNHDRWLVRAVGADGSLHVTHEKHGAAITLPADYVAQHVQLGYAATVHGAQGQTVDHCFLLVHGTEDRNLVYTAMSRGAHTNHAVVTADADGDEHNVIDPDQISPRTAAEKLAACLARDGSTESAHTVTRRAHDPVPVLAAEGAGYDEALRYAAAATLGEERMAQLAGEAALIVPGVVDADAWDTLHTHLAMLELSGTDAIAALDDAAQSRTLTGARDIAAVLDWRLDITGTPATGPGPLPWLPGIPAQLATSDRFGDWLHARHDQVTRLAGTVAENARLWPTDQVPDWAVELVDHPQLRGELAVWRASHRIADDDLAPTGAPHPSLVHRSHQDQLLTRYRRVAAEPGTAGTQFEAFLAQHAPQVLADPWWPVLAARLDLAHTTGLDVARELAAQFTPRSRALPDEHPAGALWSRLSPHLAPHTTLANRSSAATRLQPAWTAALHQHLPTPLGDVVIGSPDWPGLVAAVTHTARDTHLPPEQVITAAIDLLGRTHLPTAGNTASEAEGRIPAGALATALTWRVRDLTTEPDDFDRVSEDDVYDTEVQDFLHATAPERDTTVIDDAPAAPPTPSATPGDIPVPGTTTADNANIPWPDIEPGLSEHDMAPLPGDAAHDPAPGDQPTPAPNRDITAPAFADPAAVDQPADDQHAPKQDTTVHGVTQQGTTRARIVQLTTMAARFYTDAYDSSPAQRHFTDRFHTDPADTGMVIGYAGSDSTALIRHLRTQAGATDTELADAGLAKWSAKGWFHDVFFDRALIGIHDTRGDLVAFAGRDLSGDPRAPKYLNTPTTAAYTKRTILHGLHEGLAYARTLNVEDPDLVRVEGPMDAVAVTLAGDGHKIGVYTGGTAFSPMQADQMVQHLVPRYDPLTKRKERTAIWATDHDTAGREALQHDLPVMLQRGVTVKTMPFAGKDPAEAFSTDPTAFQVRMRMDSQWENAVQQVVSKFVEPLHQYTEHPCPHIGWSLDKIADQLALLPPEHWDEQIHATAESMPTRRWADPGDYEQFLYERVMATAVDCRDLLTDDTARIPAQAATRLHDVLRRAATTPDNPARDAAARTLNERVRPPQPTRLHDPALPPDQPQQGGPGIGL